MSLEDKVVCVVCDDTDIFVLLVNFKKSDMLKSTPIIMTSPVRNRAVTDVPPQDSGIAVDLIAKVGFSGAAIIATLHGIGKK